VSDGERPEDKKNRISFLLILFAFLGGAGYLNHGRMRPWCCTDSGAWKIVVIFFICVAIAFLISVYIRRANRGAS
jgi:hypothetical protein